MLSEGGGAATGDLPGPGDAGLQPVAGSPASLVVEPSLLDDERPRADEASVASERVEDLRQFVEAGSPQEPAEAGDPRIPCQLLVALPFGGKLGVAAAGIDERALGIRPHGPHLHAFEEAPAKADAILDEQARSAVEPGQRPGEGDHRQRHRQAGQHQVKDALAVAATAPPPAGAQYRVAQI